ncbi:phosphoglycerate mutase-like protein 4 isoform X1 [Actinidia eriantha]|uniref:phosphoglycerate mutase-like protein 4 isoform X1 n=1 Tax=Actinidia eriantha TaxID=165200 RepID=UPI002583FBC6|nr:phosphoglycerate mutase-like protein 4 isoform X1 [Actinidia eriantha]
MLFACTTATTICVRSPRFECVQLKHATHSPTSKSPDSAAIPHRRPFSMADSNIANHPRVNSESHSEDDDRIDSVSDDYAEVVVVRHGETAWNVEGRVQGHLDVELNDVGRQQAAAVADRLSKETAVSAVYSSDLKRALETAQIIARKCGVSEVIQEPNLRERHLGDLQGSVFHEAAKLMPNAYQASQSARTDQEIPGGGESLDQLFNRCTSSLQRIGLKHIGERVIVVTHGGVIRALHKRAAPTERLQGKVLNASVNIFHLSSLDKWIIKKWGDINHLNNTDFLETDFGGDNTSA